MKIFEHRGNANIVSLHRVEGVNGVHYIVQSRRRHVSEVTYHNLDRDDLVRLRDVITTELEGI